MTENGWLTPTDFYFNKIIEDNIEIIRSEFLSIMRKNLLVPYMQTYVEAGDVKRDKTGWSGFLLRKRNKWVEENCLHAPNTVALLKSFPEINNQNKGVFGFSVVHPKSEVYPHTSELSIDARHRHQLCIHPVEQLDENLTFLTVEGISKNWSYGKVLSFNDAYLHSVVNKSSRNRVVLIYDSVV